MLPPAHTLRSRLIFLNLPPSLTPDGFKAKLTEPKSLKSALVTDTKLVPKRRFAFVGYSTEDEAKAAKEWFDGSFVFGGGKVKVDFVRDEVGCDVLVDTDNRQPLAPKPAKRAKIAKETEEEDETPQPKAGPSKRLKEFMDVMKGVDPTAVDHSAAAVPGEAGWVAEGTKAAKAKASSKGKERATPKAESGDEAGEGDDDDDAAWLARRQGAIAGGDGDEPAASKVDPEDALILSTGRLFVRNLAFIATAEGLQAHFERFGPVVDVHMPVSQQTGEPLGTAFILFREAEDALSARRTLDKTTFQGRLLHVLPGRARPGQQAAAAANADAVTNGKVLGKAALARGEVKNTVDEKRKADSAKGVNWASMYMNVSGARNAGCGQH